MIYLFRTYNYEGYKRDSQTIYVDGFTACQASYQTG